MRIIKWILILLLVVIVGGIAFLFTLDLNNYKQTIQDQAKNALGRDLAIDGEIGLALSLTPSLSVEGVRLANVEGAEPADMISVGQVEAQVEILPLLSREVRISRLVLRDADIYLQADDQGGGNWVMGEPSAEAAPSEGDPIIPFLGDVLVENVNVTYVDPAGQEFRANVEQATVQADAIDSPVAIGVTGAVQGETLSVNGTVGSIQHLLNKQPDWPFELVANLAGASTSLNGAIKDTETFSAIGADVSAEVPDAGALAGLAGVTDLGPVPPVSLTTRVDQDGQIIALSDLSGLIGDASLDGNMTARLDGPVPAVQGALNIGALDLDALLPAGESEPAPAGDGRMIPDVPLPLDGLTAADADIAITAQSITAGGVTISDLATDISLAGGALDLALNQAGLFGGGLSGGVTANAASQALGLNIDFSGFDLGTILSSQGISDMLTGTGNVSVDFSGAAADLRALLAAGNGNLGVDIVGGTLDTSKLGPVSSALLKLLLPSVPSGGVIALNCAVVGFDIADGLARSNGILLNTPLFSAVSEGALDLSAETVDMLVRAQTGDVAGLSLSAPVRVGGPWAAPSPSLDAGAVVGGLTQGLIPGVEPAGLRVPDVDPPDGGVNQCAEALANPTYSEVSVPGLGDVGDTINEVIENPESLLDGAGQQLIEGITGGGESSGDGEGASDPAGAIGDALREVLPGGDGDGGGGLRNLLGN
ncbi:MAG: AsmA family protein [Pseudomonadota bacterium]